MIERPYAGLKACQLQYFLSCAALIQECVQERPPVLRNPMFGAFGEAPAAAPPSPPPTAVAAVVAAEPAAEPAVVAGGPPSVDVVAGGPPSVEGPGASVAAVAAVVIPEAGDFNPYAMSP